MAGRLPHLEDVKLLAVEIQLRPEDMQGPAPSLRPGFSLGCVRSHAGDFGPSYLQNYMQQLHSLSFCPVSFAGFRSMLGSLPGKRKICRLRLQSFVSCNLTVLGTLNGRFSKHKLAE